MNTRNLLKLKRLELGLTQMDVAKSVGVSEGTISRWESGDIASMKSDKIAKLAEVLKLSPLQIMGMDDSDTLINNPLIMPMPEFVKKRRLGVIACGEPTLAVEEYDEFDYVPAHVKCDFTLKCKGDSMVNARILDGDIVCIRSQPDVENGQIAAVVIGDEVTLKRVYKHDGSIWLQPENPAYQPLIYSGSKLADVRILGLAVAFLSNIR